MKILEAIESEDHKRKFNVDGQYKREMEKTTDEQPGIQHQKIRQYHYVQPSVGEGSPTSVLPNSHSIGKQ